MFDSLDEQMKHDEAEQVSNRERMIQYTMAVVVAVLVFGGLYLGVRLLE